MIENILPLIPKHGCYVEPFCGGATIFFAKKKTSCEILNDKNKQLINFYRVLKNESLRTKLLQKCNETLYSREHHFQAVDLFWNGNDVEKAWALWFKINTGFSGKLHGGFSTTKNPESNPARKFSNYKINLARCGHRIEDAQIESIDAIDCIRIYDSDKTFFYVDPPYLNADQGHYRGYSEADFKNLLETLTEIKGKFLLSCYPGEMIYDYISAYEWNDSSFGFKVRARNPKFGPQKEKTEMLVWNYDIQKNQMELFNA